MTTLIACLFCSSGSAWPAIRAPTLRTPILRTGLCNRKGQLASQLYHSYWVKLKLHLCMKVPSIRPTVHLLYLLTPALSVAGGLLESIPAVMGQQQVTPKSPVQWTSLLFIYLSKQVFPLTNVGCDKRKPMKRLALREVSKAWDGLHCEACYYHHTLPHFNRNTQLLLCSPGKS